MASHFVVTRYNKDDIHVPGILFVSISMQKRNTSTSPQNSTVIEP